MDRAQERQALGWRIAQLRTAQGRTLRTIGATVGCSHETVRRVEMGDPRVDLRTIHRVCVALGLTPEEGDLWLDRLLYQIARDTHAAAWLAANPDLRTVLATLPVRTWSRAEIAPVRTALVRGELAHLRAHGT